MEDATLEKPADAGKTPKDQVKFWLTELELAQKREKDWRETSETVVSIYEAEKKKTHQFNILFSNTETLLPAVYSTVPRPAVRRRFKEKDPVGLLATQIANRLLEYFLDPNQDEHGFHEMMGQVCLESLLTGRGVPWVSVKGGKPTFDSVPWDYFTHSYAKRPNQVWWIAREHHMTRQELVDNFGKIGNKVELATDSDEEGTSENDNKGSLKTACVTEIWDKNSRKVRFVSQGYKDGFLREVDDPLKLTAFFPSPAQLVWMRKVSCLTPVAPYELYEQQAEELNAVTLRINRIIKVMKVRGGYDASVEGLDKIFELEDGQLSAVENVAALQGGQGKLDNAIWLMPIEKLVAVLQQLYVQREQIKQVIYEITGLADVIRGASKASETLGAQQIKERWGNLRIRDMQGKIQNLVRSLLRTTLELAVTVLPDEQLYAITQLPAPRLAEKQAAGQAIQQAQAIGQQPPPQYVQVAQAPAFEEALALLRNDLQRSFRVDIETNSTVEAEATEDMKLMNEFMTATGQFINGVSPLVREGIMPFSAAQSMLLTMSRRLRFGPEVEEELEAMQAPQPKDDGKQVEALKMKLDQQKAAGDLAVKQQELKLEEARLLLEREQLQLERDKVLLDKQRLDLEAARLQLDAKREDQQLLLDREKLQGEWREKAEERNFRKMEGDATRSAQVESSGAPAKMEQLGGQLEELHEAIGEIQGAVSSAAAALQEVHAMAAQPKGRKIERDSKGAVVSVDGMPAQRDANGRLLGWG